MKKEKHSVWLKKLGYKEVDIHMGTFDYKIVCVIGDYKNINEYIQYKFEDPDFNYLDHNRGYEPRGQCIYRTGYVPIIWIPRLPKTPREYATLAHESLHAMCHVFRWAGLSVTDETEEVLTHGMSHIITEILNSKNDLENHTKITNKR